MMRSGPSLAAARSSNPKARSRSVRHTFRPSTTPSESIMPGGRQVQGTVQLLGRADQVEMHGRHRQLERRRQIAQQVAEIRGQTDPDLVGGRAEPRTGRLHRVERFGGKSRASTGSSTCTQSAPAWASRQSTSSYTGSSLSSNPSGFSLAPLHLPNNRNVSGPSNTGRVWMPNAAASRNWSTGLVEASLNFMPGSNSGTR